MEDKISRNRDLSAHLWGHQVSGPREKKDTIEKLMIFFAGILMGFVGGMIITFSIMGGNLNNVM